MPTQLVLLLDFGFNRDDLGFALAVILAECMCAYAVVPSERIGLICLPCFQDLAGAIAPLLLLPLFPTCWELQDA